MATNSLGLTLAYFRRLVDDHGGRRAFEDLSTLDVCTRFVMPMTEASGLSLVDHVRSQPGGDEFAKPAQWLISHSWSYKFLDVVDAIDNFCQEQELSPDTSFWFCMFANNQHAGGNTDTMFEQYMTSFRTALAHTGKMVMVLSPWHNPETLKRSWCVYEVYVSIVLNARFEVAMGTAQKAAFLDDIQDWRSLGRIQAQLNSQNSITTEPSDRDRIFQLIRDQVGFAPLDRKVFDVLQGWIVRALDVQLHAATTPEDRFRWLRAKACVCREISDYTQAEFLFHRAIAIFRQHLPVETFWQGWEAVFNVGYLKARLSHPRESWQPLLDEAFPKLEAILGKEHSATVYSMKCLGQLHCHLEEYDRGLALLWSCLEVQQRLHDPAQTYSTMLNLGIVLSRRRQLPQAEAMLRQAFDGYSELYGPSHHSTCAARNGLAICYSYLGRFKDSLRLHEINYEDMVRTRGDRHHDTNCVLVNLAEEQRCAGDFEGAVINLHRALAFFEAEPNAVWALHCQYELGLLLLLQGDPTQAQATLERVHTAFRAMCGPQSSDAVKALRSLCYAIMESPPDTSKSAGEECADIDRLLDKLDAAHVMTETTVSCHGCFTPIHGTMAMCSKCPRYSLCFCQGCVASKKAHRMCTHHNDAHADRTEWIHLKPPGRYFLELKVTLLASTDQPDACAAAAAQYASYCAASNVDSRRDTIQTSLDAPSDVCPSRRRRRRRRLVRFAAASIIAIAASIVVVATLVRSA